MDHILLNLSSTAASQADNHSCHWSLNFFHFYCNYCEGWWLVLNTTSWAKAHYWFIECLYNFSNLFHAHFLTADARGDKTMDKTMSLKYTKMEDLRYNPFLPLGEVAHLTTSMLQKMHIRLGCSGSWTFDFQCDFQKCRCLLCYCTFSK